jgi:Flp pilus assembly protein TadG
LVEFALLLPLFMMMVLGMFTGGIAYNQKISLNSAAREGARYAATLDNTSLSPVQWTSAVRDVVRDRAGSDLPSATSGGVVCVAMVDKDGNVVTDASTPPVKYQLKDGDTTLPEGCFDDSVASPTGDTSNRVHVLVRRTSKIEALVFSHNATIRSMSTARWER